MTAIRQTATISELGASEASVKGKTELGRARRQHEKAYA